MNGFGVVFISGGFFQVFGKGYFWLFVVYFDVIFFYVFVYDVIIVVIVDVVVVVIIKSFMWCFLWMVFVFCWMSVFGIFKECVF